MTHVTPEVMPPALAIAERDGLSGRALLTAIAVGCEVTTRVGIGTDYPKFRARGWHGIVYRPGEGLAQKLRALGVAV